MQHQQQHHHPSPHLITLPLHKFSYAEDAASQTDKFSWKHTTKDLMVVFDTYRSLGAGQSSQMMKVLQGSLVLEELNIQDMIGKCDEVIEFMRQHTIEVRYEQLPISALVRSPLFAIRYNLPGQKVRRIQLKFTSKQDFDVVFNHLNRLGLRISDSIPPSAAKKPATPSVQTTQQPPTPVAPMLGHTPALRTSAFPSPAPASFPNLTGHSNGDSGSSLPPWSGSESTASSSRPGSALLFQLPDTVAPLLPPRRQLPFKRPSPPKSSGSDHVKGTSRPSSSAMGPPPRPASTHRGTSSSGRQSNSTLDLPPLPQPTIINGTGTSTRNLGSSVATDRSWNAVNKPTQDPQQPQPLPQSQLPSSSTATNESSMLDRLVKEIAAAGDSHSDQLAKYASQSADERSAILNDFILEHLEDDNFLTLCEDMETCWRRIVLEER